jgi:hypothetical protein
MQHKPVTVHPAKSSSSDAAAQQIAAIVAPVILLGLIVLFVRVVYVRVKYLWQYGEIPRVYLRGNVDKRRKGN